MMRGRQWLNWLGLVIGALLFVYQLWLSSKSLSVDFSISALWILAAGLATCLHLTQVGIWSHLIMRGVGVNLPFKPILNVYLLSGLVRYVPGGFWGYLSRSQWLFARFAVSYQVANTGSVLQVLGWVVAAGCMAGGYQTLVSYDARRVVFFALMIFALVGTWCALRALARWKRFEWLMRHGVMDPERLRLSFRQWLMIVLAYLILWIGWGGVMFLAAGNIGNVLRWNLFDAAFVYVVAWLTGFAIAFVPAGLGVRELALSSLLIAQTGMSVEQASAIAVAMRFLTLLAELLALIVGAIETLLVPVQN